MESKYSKERVQSLWMLDSKQKLSDLIKDMNILMISGVEQWYAVEEGGLNSSMT